jgi:hypothetical protein
MRPDKPGYWWYKRCGAFLEPIDCVRVIALGGVLYVSEYDEQVTIQQFEERRYIRFVKWLGQAHPPKKVDRYTMETVYGSGGPTTESAMEKCCSGAWVRYNDVKEYLLDEMETFETGDYSYANPEQEDNEE